MNIKSIIAAAASVLLLSSCSLFQKSSSNSLDFTNGRQAGTVLSSLASQYLSSGKLDLSNVQNILSLATLANSLSSLRSESNQSQLDFGKGLMAGNPNINQNNLSGVVSGLSALGNMNLDKVSDSLQKGTASTQTVSSVSSQLESVLSLLKK